MGRRGPTPAPTSLKIIRGDQEHRINRNEPQPTGEVTPTSPLSAAERKVWKRLAPELLRQRVLTSNDAAALTTYCHFEVRYGEAMADVKQFGASLVETRGTGGSQYEISVVNPSWRVAMDAANQMLKLGAQFGLTPSSRQGLTVEAGSADVSSTADFFS